MRGECGDHCPETDEEAQAGDVREHVGQREGGNEDGGGGIWRGVARGEGELEQVGADEEKEAQRERQREREKVPIQ